MFCCSNVCLFVLLLCFASFTNKGECQSYKNLSEPDRNKEHQNQLVSCDRSFAGQWYRFTGQAGDQMPESPVPRNKCGTHAPGWLNGTHPSVAERVVSRKVCFHWSNNNCHWSTMIQVRNCGNYFVYKLGKPPACSLRYCGESKGKLELRLFIVKSKHLYSVKYLVHNNSIINNNNNTPAMSVLKLTSG